MQADVSQYVISPQHLITAVYPALLLKISTLSLHNSSLYTMCMDAASAAGIKRQLLGGLTGV